MCLFTISIISFLLKFLHFALLSIIILLSKLFLHIWNRKKSCASANSAIRPWSNGEGSNLQHAPYKGATLPIELPLLTNLKDRHLIFYLSDLTPHGPRLNWVNQNIVHQISQYPPKREGFCYIGILFYYAVCQRIVASLSRISCNWATRSWVLYFLRDWKGITANFILLTPPAVSLHSTANSAEKLYMVKKLCPLHATLRTAPPVRTSKGFFCYLFYPVW